MKARHIPTVTFLAWAVVYAIVGITTGGVGWHYGALGCFTICVFYVLGLGLYTLWLREKKD